ncbi:exopolyphosphatase/guanosine-5'-triphosphate,3'-diphosphate pyrophosphatase [Kitasatospora sp. SolWspMP-SS2h]|uniref:Ppx/GppA phosphatase family protein n=1 Tax=Kitasatospora sp. SolWspMP-SS2h TaxID=1305729 RepID=UPI000DBAA63E|nr:Ppx/GppA phosphatase family protein [Kitasatospora sp. SolWspMP-SS2h]RAJ36031.1 exopolyphosphatase/guanosine-5'-triphosphate,3'-diphosphate pyrophosphatase [Kitasatospora sp. SolWspMP-SS2h]
MSPTRVAAIDCGTNSIRLLIADLDPETGAITDLDRRMLIVRLGQDVDRTGRLHPEALARTFAACREYAEVIAAHGVAPERVRMVATSASRDAENAAEFTAGVKEILGVEPSVVSGDEEARLSFTGATRELLGGPHRPPYLVFDLGGGSTEFVLGEQDVRAGYSTDIGCVRMTERHFAGGRPTEAQIEAARADIRAALDTVAEAVPLDSGATLVGLAGTVTTVAGIALELPGYDSERIHHAVLDVARVRETARWLLHSSHAERAAVPVMHPGRVDVIAAGALVLLEIMERTGAAELLVSEHDILDGIAWSIA